MSATTKRVLPADVYDALEMSALAYGGIGAGEYCEGDIQVPYCIIGHANRLGDQTFTSPHEVATALREVGVFVHENDKAVRAINARSGVKNTNARVSFADWCAELGVERGA